jgi:hypothetical protein
VCIVDQEGTVIKEGTVASEPKAMTIPLSII